MRLRMLAYPLHTLPTALAPVFVAVGLAVHDGVFRPLPALVAFLCGWMVHVGGVVADDLELVRRHPGLREHPELEDALEDGSLTLGAMRRAVLGWFAAAILFGTYLFVLAPWPTLLLGAIGILASWGYAAGPFPWARIGIAAPVFFLMFGCVAVIGTYYVQAPGPVPLAACLVGLPVGALVVNVLLIDDLRDHAFDRAKSWRTGAVRFGVPFVQAEIRLLTGFAYLCPVLFWLALDTSFWVLLPLLTLPAAWLLARHVTHPAFAETSTRTTGRAAVLSAMFGALLGLGLAL